MQGNVSFWASAIHIFQVGPSSYQTYSNLLSFAMHTVGLCSQEGFVGLFYFNSSCCSTSFSSFFVRAIYMLKSSKFIQQHKQLMF